MRELTLVIPAKFESESLPIFYQEIANLNCNKIVILDADLAGGTGCHHFLKKYPKRFFQCGIAEQNMISVAAGMSSLGLIPFATTFAVFALRAYEQARLSISYSNLNVKIENDVTLTELKKRVQM